MRFGILGWGKIARTQLAPAIAQAGHEVVAIGSRSPLADTLTWTQDQPPARWTTYDGVLQDPRVEAVYIALPNDAHVPWSLKALAAGHHVLCEKPMALSLADVDRLSQAAHTAQRHLHEAYMVLHHPQWAALKALDVGAWRHLQVAFSYDNRDPANIRNQAALGGGALWDIGCYAVLLGHWLMDRAPDAVRGQSTRHPDWGTDIHTQGELRWGDASVLQFSVSTQSARHQSAVLVGERGWVALDAPFNPPTQAPWRASDGLTLPSLPEVNQYTAMVHDFVAKAEAGLPTDLRLSRDVTETLLRLHAAAHTPS
jgi:predicted dehydrogenase